MAADKLFDYDEKAAARILGISPRTLRQWRKDGKAEHYVTPGGRIRYSTEQLVALQRGCRVKASAPAPQAGKAVGGLSPQPERGEVAANVRTFPHSAAQP